MVQLIYTVLAILLLLIINEWWWRDRTHGEASRKFIHLTVGTFVAFWPLFLSTGQIVFLSGAFVAVVLISQRFNIFRAIHAVQRPTHGEVFFGLAVGAVALLTKNPAIYAAALLHMSLADGIAAIVGVRYGASNSYRIFAAHKSVVGTLAFMTVSTVIIAAYAMHVGSGFLWTYPALIAGATLLENLAVRGLDNLLIPVLVACILGFVL